MSRAIPCGYGARSVLGEKKKKLNARHGRLPELHTSKITSTLRPERKKLPPTERRPIPKCDGASGLLVLCLEKWVMFGDVPQAMRCHHLSAWLMTTNRDERRLVA